MNTKNLGGATSLGSMLILAALLSHLVALANAEDNSTCTLCPPGEEVTLPNEVVTIDLGPMGNLRQTCSSFETIITQQQGECLTVSSSIQDDCGCLPFSSNPSVSPSSFSESPSFVAPSSICGCQPSQYVFQLNFSSPCALDAFESEGIEAQGCRIDTDATDTTYASVQTVYIFEQDQLGSEAAFRLAIGNFTDGAEFSFLSAMLVNPDVSNPPKTLGVILRGINSQQEPITSRWSVTFTNECHVFPVIRGGEETLNTMIVSSSSYTTSTRLARSRTSRASFSVKNNV